MELKTINIKEDMPPADVAVCQLEIFIEAYKNSNVGALKVIHGYGSHGKGGEIKKLLRQKLPLWKKQGKINDYIPGEKWGEEAIKNFNITENFPQLILDSDLKNYNNGLTIILLKL